MPKKPKIKEEYQYKYERCMKISELIKELQAVKKNYGDLPVGHYTEGLEMYISPKYRPIVRGEKTFPVIEVSNMYYWKKDSPQIAILDNYSWSILEETERKKNEKDSDDDDEDSRWN